MGEIKIKELRKKAEQKLGKSGFTSKNLFFILQDVISKKTWFLLCRYDFFSGEKFDIKDYHHVFLSAGPMGIDTLEEAVDEYIANSLRP